MYLVLYITQKVACTSKKWNTVPQKAGKVGTTSQLGFTQIPRGYNQSNMIGSRRDLLPNHSITVITVTQHCFGQIVTVIYKNFYYLKRVFSLERSAFVELHDSGHLLRNTQ